MIKQILISTLLISLFIGCNNKNPDSLENTDHSNEHIDNRKSIHQQDLEKYSNSTNNENDPQDYNIVLLNSESINDKSIGSFNSPKFTMDGKNLIFTNQNYSQLWLYNIDNKLFEKIVDLPQCGINFQISENNEIYFLNKAIKGKNHGRIFSILKYSITQKKIEVIYNSQKRISSPILVDGSLYFREDELPKNISLTSRLVGKHFKVPYFFVKNNILIKVSNNVDSLSAINKKYKFIACRYSKDGEYIFALTSKNGTIIFNMDGNPINQFKNAISVSKLYKSNLVVYSNENDDGQKITSSELFVGFINQTINKKLDNIKKELRFNPDWSPRENKIAYNTDSGIIKIISFNIEKKINDN